jgi:ABC-type multidrug transport system ATPase subunit
MSQNVIEVRDLAKHYPPDIKAVDGISFSIPSGTVFSLLGPNGAGKTTTVEMLEDLRDTMVYGNEASALVNLAVLLVIGVVFFVLASRLMSWKER